MKDNVKGDANTQYLVMVVKLDLDELAEDIDAEAMDSVQYEYDDDNEIAERWFDESYCSAEIDDKIRELFGKGCGQYGVHILTRGDYLLAAAKGKKDVAGFLRKRLGLWS